MTATKERGQVWAAFLVCLGVLLVIMAIVGELAPAFSQSLNQRQALARAQSELTLPSSILLDGQGTTMAGPDTGYEVAKRAVSAVRDAGFDGKVTVWFYEPPVGVYSRVDANDRVWAWEVDLSQQAPTILSSATGSNGITITSSEAGSANPYARARVFRSSISSGGEACRYVCEAGDEIVLEDSSLSFESMPTKLKDVFNDTINSLRSE